MDQRTSTSVSYSSNPTRYVCHRAHTRADHPLKTGFLLSDGCTSVTVPEVPTGDNYIVDRKSSQVVFANGQILTGRGTVMGDSGDVTDAFSIVPSE
jgi:hypothetical protein